jgi:putative glycerol-1-phosphate prenyltransferase
MSVLHTLQQHHREHSKALAVLIDPDKVDDASRLQRLIRLASESNIGFFFVGGSLITNFNLHEVIRKLKEETAIPVILFPGSSLHMAPQADAILFLSLISGRNPDLLIGQHVQAAPIIKSSRLEVLPTGYILINSGRLTSVAYISNTTPIPEDKYSLAACTAMAGEMLGLKLIYLDAGSGAERAISPKMIATVRKATTCPLIVGGGIDSGKKAQAALEAGADLIVVGNALEKDPELLIDMADLVYDWNRQERQPG